MASNINISYRQGIRNKGFQVTVPTTGATQTLSLSALQSHLRELFSQALPAPPPARW